MANNLDRFASNLVQLVDTKEDKAQYFGGLLGTLDANGHQIVDVPGRSNFSYVRLNGSFTEVIEAFNTSVSTTEYGLKVRVVKKPQEFFYQVESIDVQQYPSYGGGGTNPFITKHAFTHSFGSGAGVGTDPVFLYKRQLLQPMGVHPVSTGTAMYAYAESDFYTWNNEITLFQGANTVDFTAQKPTGAFHRWMTIYLDGATNGLGYVTGAYFQTNIYSPTTVPYIPEISPTLGIPLAAVLLNTGTTTVNWDNLFDLRNFLNAGGATVAGVTGTVQGAILFGGVSGTISQLPTYLSFNNTQLMIGTTGTAFTTNGKLIILQTGSANAAITLVGYDNFPFIAARGLHGSPLTPLPTTGSQILFSLEISGFSTGTYTGRQAHLRFKAGLVDWTSTNHETFWELAATASGTITETIFANLRAEYSEFYHPIKSDTFQIGISTGTVFRNQSNQSGTINYYFPIQQGISGTYLSNDGAGNLSWQTLVSSGGSVGGTGVATRIPIWFDQTTLYSDASFFINTGTNLLTTPSLYANGTIFSTSTIQATTQLISNNKLWLVSSGIDAQAIFTQGAINWSLGIDYSDANMFKLSKSNTLGTSDFLRIDNDFTLQQGNLVLTGTGARFVADFDNATISNRLHFITSKKDSATNVGIIPNGTGTISVLQVLNSSDPNNATRFQFTATYLGMQINVNAAGTGITNIPLVFQMYGTEYVRLTPTGSFGIGTISPRSEFHVASTQLIPIRGIISSQHSDGAQAAVLLLQKSRGTNSSPTTILTGDNLGNLSFYGYDGSNYIQSTAIIGTSEGTVTGTSRVPSRLMFYTSTDVSPSVITERMRIDSGGHLSAYGGMNLGTATGAAIGNLYLSSLINIGNGAIDGILGEVLRINYLGYGTGTYRNSIYSSISVGDGLGVLDFALAKSTTTQVTALRLDNVRNAFIYGALNLGGLSGALSGTVYGYGYKFPASQIASSDVNTLDDYEEGVFTGTLTPGTSGSITLNNKILTYTKVGRKVTICGYVSVTSVSSPVGTLTLGGLPFVCDNAIQFYAAVAVWASGLSATATTSIVGYVPYNTNTIRLEKYAAGGPTNLAGDVVAASAFMINVTYFTTT